MCRYGKRRGRVTYLSADPPGQVGIPENAWVIPSRSLRFDPRRAAKEQGRSVKLKPDSQDNAKAAKRPWRDFKILSKSTILIVFSNQLADKVNPCPH